MFLTSQSLHAVTALAILAVTLNACKKNTTGPGDGPPVSFVQVPQVEIPWPSLANSPWPTFLHDPQHTGRSLFRGPQLGQVEWAYETGDHVYSSPVLGADGTVYAQGLDGFLYALSPAGGLLWRFDLGGASEAETTVGADGTIYVCPSVGGRFFAISPAGSLKWQYSPGGKGAYSAPLLSLDRKTVFFVAGDTVVNSRSLFALSAENGSLRWKFTPGALDLTLASAAFSPDGRTLYCAGQGSSQASLYAVDTAGVQKWRFLTSPSGSSTSYASTPSVDNAGNIYFCSENALYSLTPAGSLRWQVSSLSVSSFNNPVIGPDGSIYASGSSLLYAFDNGGTLRWSQPLPPSQCTPAIDREGTIYVGSSRAGPDTANFFAFKSDGSVKFKMRLTNPSGETIDITSSPALSADGRLYGGSDRVQTKRVFKIR